MTACFPWGSFALLSTWWSVIVKDAPFHLHFQTVSSMMILFCVPLANLHCHMVVQLFNQALVSFTRLTHDDYFRYCYNYMCILSAPIILSCFTNPLYAYCLIWVRLISARDAWITSCFPYFWIEAAFTKFSFFSDWWKATASPKFKQDSSKPAL